MRSIRLLRKYRNKITYGGGGTLSLPFILKHQYAYSPYCLPYIFHNAVKENLYNNQELLWLTINSFTLVTFNGLIQVDIVKRNLS